MGSRIKVFRGHVTAIIVLTLLAFLASGCASTRPPLEFSFLTIRHTDPSIRIRLGAQDIGKSVFAVQIYVLNNASYPVQLLLDNVLLLDQNAVVLKRLSPTEGADLMMIDLGYNEFADPNKFRAALETASLKNSYIIPSTAAQGKVYWFKNSQRWPVFLHITIGGEVFQFQIDIKDPSDGKDKTPCGEARQS